METCQDPYTELEVYLHRVQEEIEEVLERLGDGVRWGKARCYSPEAEDSGLERSSELLDCVSTRAAATQTSPSPASSITNLSSSSEDEPWSRVQEPWQRIRRPQDSPRLQPRPGPLWLPRTTEDDEAPLINGHSPEIEAAEACKWLRAAGFPQYAQMYEDCQLPMEVGSVAKDHPLLDADALQSLFRRLHTLNRVAAMKVEPAPAADEDDEDDPVALSDKWTFQPEIRRWSRVCDPQDKAQGGDSDSSGVIRYGSLPPAALSSDSEVVAAKFRRTGSERLRDGAKALLRRVESLKSRRRHPRRAPDLVISSPLVLDVQEMEKRMRGLGMSGSPPGSPRSTPPPRRFLSRPEVDTGALSDSELHQPYYASSKERDIRPARIQKVPEMSSFKETGEIESGESSSAIADSDSDTTPKHRNRGVVRWHSFQRAGKGLDEVAGRPIAALSAGQMAALRKVALLKLTALMERHCPTHRSGWNWELPKFMRKIKSPDYKDKLVFGVPLEVILQRTGRALPEPIHAALSWLMANALDQVGLFRKPGVRSRIAKLKAAAEDGALPLDGQQAYDVADMVKQYFRELPDPLLTGKLSDTFIAIFQYVPPGLRGEAVRCCLVLLPDEHREALQALLSLLAAVATAAPSNQMTAPNLAVCLAPTLFHCAPANPRNDPKDMAPNKAAHDCLVMLIKQQASLALACRDLVGHCRWGYLEESLPAPLDELGDSGWRAHTAAAVAALLREPRDRSRGWVARGQVRSVDIAYRKVGDGHPLRLWKLWTEVEAPPGEVMVRVLRERHVWDPTLSSCRTVRRLDHDADIFTYTSAERRYYVLRVWRTELAKGACAIVEMSIAEGGSSISLGSSSLGSSSLGSSSLGSSPSSSPIHSSVPQGCVLASRFLIEPCGSGRSRILHLSRVDTKGRLPEWYNKSWGHLVANHLANIRDSFKHSATGPESKV